MYNNSKEKQKEDKNKKYWPNKRKDIFILITWFWFNFYKEIE